MNDAAKTLEILDGKKPQYKIVPESFNKFDSVPSMSNQELERQLRLYAEAELNYNNPRKGIGIIFIGFINII
jgi:hypothetical protein